MAVLNYGQMSELNTSGILPQYFNQDGEEIPQYSFITGKSSFGAGKEWKLFPQYIGVDDLVYMYRRMDIAANAVDIPAKDIWAGGVTVKVIGSRGEELKDSELERQIWKMNQDLSVLAKFEEGHRYARMLGMGVVVIGLNDGKKLAEKPDRATGVDYLRAFSKKEVVKIEYDRVPTSETYGEIIEYSIKIGGQSSSQAVDFIVHVDRVIHVMEKTIEASAFGLSVLEPPYDLFQVLKNTDWSAGEAYYQNASPLFVVSWDDSEDAEPPDQDEIDDLKDDIEDIHVKKRYIKPASWSFDVVKGMGELPDPGKVWEPIVERIAGAVKIPKSILLGTSAGALASGETNLQQYYKDISGQQSNFAEPLLNDFYGRLQKWGVLPTGDFDLEWPSLWEPTDKDVAEINKMKMETANVAVGNTLGGVALMTVEEAREQILDMNPKLGAGRLPTIKQDMADNPEPLLQTATISIEYQLKSIVERLQRGDISLEAAEAEWRNRLEDQKERMKTYAFEHLMRGAPADRKAELTTLKLTPEDEAMIAKDLEELMEYGLKIFRDVAQR